MISSSLQSLGSLPSSLQSSPGNLIQNLPAGVALWAKLETWGTSIKVAGPDLGHTLGVPFCLAPEPPWGDVPCLSHPSARRASLHCYKRRGWVWELKEAENASCRGFSDSGGNGSRRGFPLFPFIALFSKGTRPFQLPRAQALSGKAGPHVRWSAQLVTKCPSWSFFPK